MAFTDAIQGMTHFVEDPNVIVDFAKKHKLLSTGLEFVNPKLAQATRALGLGKKEKKRKGPNKGGTKGERTKREPRKANAYAMFVKANYDKSQSFQANSKRISKMWRERGVKNK